MLVPLLFSAAASVELPAATLDPVIIEIPEATEGPPEQTCEESLALAREDVATREPVVQPTTTAPRPPREPGPTPEAIEAALDDVIIDGRHVDDLPGAHPDEVPLQPIEGSAEALAHLATAYTRPERGDPLRITVFGASHTSADFWTGQIRRVLQERWGDRGHGFVFPAALYKGYRGTDINLCRTDGWRVDWVGKRDGRHDGLYGFAGASVSSADPADFGWTQTTVSNPQGRKISRYDIYTLAQPEGGTLLLTVDEAPPRAIPTKADEIGLQRHQLRVPDGPHRVTMQPLGDGEVRVFGVSAERDAPGVIVDALGIRGRTARTWLDWDKDIAGEGLASLDPDIVILAYGTNEANDLQYDMEEYRRDLRGVLARMRYGAPDAACVLVGPSDRAKPAGHGQYREWARTGPVAQVQREVAPEFGCAFWDWQQATGGPGSMVAFSLLRPQLAGRDLIHFTTRGYIWSADRFIAALDELKP